MSSVYYHYLVFLLSVGCRGAVSSTADLGKPDILSYVGYHKIISGLPSHAAPHGFRTGDASKSNSCSRVRHVPVSLRFYWFFKPSGIQRFYTKYTEAYGIPVIGSNRVTDDALKRACYVLRFSLADHSKIRQSFYKLYGRVAVLGLNENVTDLPDYSFLSPEINHRARGLGPTESVPVVSGAEENLLCHREDRYFGEDILLHETAHGVDMAVRHQFPGWQPCLVESYRKANASGRWSNTYSSTSPEEYLAEGVQSYFGVNSYSDPPDGVHGPVNTPDKLQQYDTNLYHLIELLFPCRNVFLRPCQSNRTAEAGQVLKMDCDVTVAYAFKAKTLLADISAPHNSELHKSAPSKAAPFRGSTSEMCRDKHIHCQAWSKTGECQTNSVYMNSQCQVSCGTCSLVHVRLGRA